MKNRRKLTAEQLAAAKRLHTIYNRKKKALGFTQHSISLAAGWKSGSAFGQYATGKIPLNIPALVSLSGLLEVDPEEIYPELAAKLSPIYNRVPGLDLTEPAGIFHGKYVFVRLLSIHASAGNGFLNSDEELDTLDSLAFRRDWLAKKGLRPSDLAVVRAVGDSMSPYISDGDVILIQRSKEAPKHGEVWAIHQKDSGVRVKRLLFRESGDLIIRSDNMDKILYPDEIIPSHCLAEEINTIGKIVWRGG